MNVQKLVPASGDPTGDVLTRDCPGREIFNHMTSRWGLLLLLVLVDGRLRFHELRDRVEGISEKMLSQVLKTLVRDGLVERFVEATIPPRVSYELTPMGQEVSVPLTDIIDWIGRRIPDVLAARELHDAQARK